MPRTVHHDDIVARLGPRGFEAVRGTRDAVRPKNRAIRMGKPHLDEAALSRAIRAGVASGFARADAATARAKASTVAAEAAVTRLADSMDRLKGAVDTYAAGRRLHAEAAQAAAVRDAAIAARTTPASVQAANAARWPRAAR